MLEKAFENAGKIYDSDVIEKALPRLARETIEDLLTHVGRGEIKPLDVIRATDPDFEMPASGKLLADKQPKKEPDQTKNSVGQKPSHSSSGDIKPIAKVPVLGAGDAAVLKFSKSARAVPGDRIVGINTPGEGVVVYPKEAKAIAAFEDDPSHLIDLSWDIEEAKGLVFLASIRALATHAPGTLATITTVIADHSGNILNLVMHSLADDFTEIEIDVEVRDRDHLQTIIGEISRKPVVARVSRIMG